MTQSLRRSNPLNDFLSVPFETTGVTRVRWECRHCEETFRGISSGEANPAGREHLLENHREQLVDQYRTKVMGESCRKGCAYEFPRDPGEIEELVCPEYGTDNLKFYAEKAVWDAMNRQ